jgi:hypothetical protein
MRCGDFASSISSFSDRVRKCQNWAHASSPGELNVFQPGLGRCYGLLLGRDQPVL